MRKILFALQIFLIATMYIITMRLLSYCEHLVNMALTILTMEERKVAIGSRLVVFLSHYN